MAQESTSPVVMIKITIEYSGRPPVSLSYPLPAPVYEEYKIANNLDIVRKWVNRTTPMGVGISNIVIVIP